MRNIFLITAEALQCQIELVAWVGGWLGRRLKYRCFRQAVSRGSTIDLKLKLHVGRVRWRVDVDPIFDLDCHKETVQCHSTGNIHHG